MPLTDTGTPRNVAAFLSLFGEAVILEDASTIKGVFKIDVIDEFVGAPPNRRYYVYRLWISNLDEYRGTFGAKQLVQIRGVNYFVADYQVDEDNWINALLSHE